MKFLSTALLTLSLVPASGFAQMIVAHRGASFDAPENTLAAFELAWEQNADAIEGDFYVTADQKIVCIHDKTTKRTAGSELKVSESTYDQLKDLDVGRWKADRYAGERISLLEDVLKIVPENKIFLIELKSGPEIVEPLTKVLENSPVPRENLRIICFNDEVVAQCKEAMPDIKAFWLTSFKQNEENQTWSPTAANVLATLKRLNCDGVDTKAERAVVTQKFVDEIKTAGYEYHVWTVNDPADAKYFSKIGVDSITTDRPEFIRDAIGK